MEKEEMLGKFHEELKWGSYYFIFSIPLGLAIAFFQVFVFANRIFSDSLSILLSLILLVYFSSKCIAEKKIRQDVSFASKVFTISAVFGIHLLYVTLILNTNNACIIPKREIEIVEVNE